MEVWHESLTDAFNLLCGRKLSFTNYPMWEKESIKDENAPFVGYNLTEKSCISSIPAVAKESMLTMRGRLLGGCMDCLINLLGTSFDHVREFNERYSDDGIIWFLEACDLNVMGMRRAMWQMKKCRRLKIRLKLLRRSVGNCRNLSVRTAEQYLKIREWEPAVSEVLLLFLI